MNLNVKGGSRRIFLTFYDALRPFQWRSYAQFAVHFKPWLCSCAQPSSRIHENKGVKVTWESTRECKLLEKAQGKMCWNDRRGKFLLFNDVRMIHITNATFIFFALPSVALDSPEPLNTKLWTISKRRTPEQPRNHTLKMTNRARPSKAVHYITKINIAHRLHGMNKNCNSHT